MIQPKISSLAFENACKSFSKLTSNVEKDLKTICYFITNTKRDETEIRELFTKHEIFEKLIEIYKYIPKLNNAEVGLLYNVISTTIDIDDGFANALIKHNLCQKFLDSILQNSIFTKVLFVLIHNIARYPGNEYLFKNENLKTKLYEEIKSNTNESNLVCMLLLLSILDETEYISLGCEGDLVESLLKYSNRAYIDPRHRYKGFCLWELLNALRRVSFNRHLKLFLKIDKLVILIQNIFLSYKHLKEIEMSVWILSNLCFDNIVKKKLLDIFNFQQLIVKYEQSSQLLNTLFGHIKWQIGLTKLPETLSIENCKFDIFISYSNKDEALIKPLITILENENFKIFKISIKNVKVESMLDGINKSKLFLACVTENFLASMNCRSDIKFAYEIRKPITGIMRFETIPIQSWLELYLQDKHLFKYTDNLNDEKFDKLVSLLHQMISLDKTVYSMGASDFIDSLKIHKISRKSSKKVNFSDTFEPVIANKKGDIVNKAGKQKFIKSLSRTESSDSYMKPKHLKELDKLLDSINVMSSFEANKLTKKPAGDPFIKKIFKSFNKSDLMAKIEQSKMLKSVTDEPDSLNKKVDFIKKVEEDKQLKSTKADTPERNEMIYAINAEELTRSDIKIETPDLTKNLLTNHTTDGDQPIKSILRGDGKELTKKSEFIRLINEDTLFKLGIKNDSGDSTKILQNTINLIDDKFTSNATISQSTSSISTEIDISAYSITINQFKVPTIGNWDENQTKLWLSEKNLMKIYNKMHGINGSMLETLIQQYRKGLSHFREILKPYNIKMIDCDKFYGEIMKLERLTIK